MLKDLADFIIFVYPMIAIPLLVSMCIVAMIGVFTVIKEIRKMDREKICLKK
ncbi:TPA: hypothetical protein ACGXL9_006094 [Bacillus mobilis]